MVQELDQCSTKISIIIRWHRRQSISGLLIQFVFHFFCVKQSVCVCVCVCVCPVSCGKTAERILMSLGL